MSKQRTFRSGRHAAWAVALLACSWVAIAKASDDQFAAFRDMLSEDNPGEFWIDAGRELFHKPRGPKQRSLEACDFGLGPGVLKGAYAQLPRYFADTGRVQTLEGRLVTCMVRLQGFKEEDILRPTYLNSAEENSRRDELTQLAAYVASQSNGMPFKPPMQHPKEKQAYALGEYVFHRRMGMMDLSCAHCHGERARGQQLRGVDLPIMTDPATAGKVTTAFPAYVLKDSNVRTWWWRNHRCNLAMRLPWLKLGSDIDAALTLYQVMTGSQSGAPIQVPGLKPRA
ncbi:SoxAX cytochrome complex subunit A [Tepidimonas alkaliphilus]|uniref:L-cysteine S-thiosulfotransferase subunit SoxA n=1 Tax=Tepidimonas alkaliphilus TaxID=2588942 RepID=A0A554WBI7_9BURK|nr:sulfur oxidation c-type cytochrome SoxA [Tepidimonas alkaliphilus]TSE20940.1 SoxAX cytochrome complex subunit A [Tepidimonas alkaliphilus]